jgi:hypothetical protein
MILAPKRPDSYRTPASIFGLARDVEGLKGILARLQKAELDLGDATRETKEFLSGQSDARHAPLIRKSLDRARRGWPRPAIVKTGRSLSPWGTT